MSLEVVLWFPHLLQYSIAVPLMKGRIYFLTAWIHLLWPREYGRSCSVPVLSLRLNSHCTILFSILLLCLHSETKSRPASWGTLETWEREWSPQSGISMDHQLPENPLPKNDSLPSWDQTHPRVVDHTVIVPTTYLTHMDHQQSQTWYPHHTLSWSRTEA